MVIEEEPYSGLSLGELEDEEEEAEEEESDSTPSESTLSDSAAAAAAAAEEEEEEEDDLDRALHELWATQPMPWRGRGGGDDDDDYRPHADEASDADEDCSHNDLDFAESRQTTSGPPWVCNMAPCEQVYMPTHSGLRRHVMRVHKRARECPEPGCHGHWFLGPRGLARHRALRHPRASPAPGPRAGEDGQPRPRRPHLHVPRIRERLPPAPPRTYTCPWAACGTVCPTRRALYEHAMHDHAATRPGQTRPPLYAKLCPEPACQQPPFATATKLECHLLEKHGIVAFSAYVRARQQERKR